MSSHDDLWDQLTQRVVHSQVGGVTAETDDVLAAADLMEALINPHRGAQGGASGMGAPGMMPPMMMGGMGGGASGASGAGGPGGAGVTSGPLQGAQGPLASSTQRPVPAGVPGEAREVEPTAEPPAGRPAGASSGPLPGSTARPPGQPGEAGAGDPPEPVMERASEVSGAAFGSAVSADEDPPHRVDGFSIDPAVVRTLGERWTGWSHQLSALTAYPEASMGLFEEAQRPHQALAQQLNAWHRGAVDEFDAVGARLHRNAARYESVDDDHVAEVRHVGGVDA